MDIKEYIRNINDFPEKGIIFRDITPLMQNAKAFSVAVNEMCNFYYKDNIDLVIGIESRGFIFGAALALKLKCGFVPARKPNKLPANKISECYKLEYGAACLEMHTDAIKPGQRVLIADDVLATGGTAEAAIKLCKRLKAQVVGTCFLIELKNLGGRERIKKYNVFSLIKY